MSEHEHRPKSAGQRALDLFVYAPTGLLLSSLDDFPRLATRGRAALEQHMRNARFVGEFVVRQKRGEFQARATRAQERIRPRRAPAAGPSVAAVHHEPAVRPAPSEHVASDGEATGTVVPLHHEPAAPRAAPPLTSRYDTAPVDSVIPGYDTLSASQVVRRLEGLGPAELDTVVHHEAEGRGRRTILHRAHQLLGDEAVPGDEP